MLIGSKSVSNGYEHVYTGIAIVSGILFGCKVLYNFFGAQLIGWFSLTVCDIFVLFAASCVWISKS